MPCVVADTSPLFYLAVLGRLALLHDLYGQVFLPDSVWKEALAGERFAAGTRPLLEDAQNRGWIVVRGLSVPSAPPPSLALADLDIGERDALILAITLHAELVLIDELEGRAVAESLGLSIMGTVGILVSAKQQGFLPAIRPELSRLLNETTFWLSRRLEHIALEMAGEADPPNSIP